MASAAEFQGRILDRDAAVAWRAKQRVAGKTVVFTNGCFDVVHAGHTTYLAWARSLGDALVVGLNGDASVRRLKGPERPFVPWAGRAAVLAALRSVDLVVGFEETTPVELIAALAPDVHVKSEQYRIDELPERDVVEAHGGRVVLAPHVAGNSTTDLVATIRARG